MSDPHKVPPGCVIPYLTIPSRGGQAAVFAVGFVFWYWEHRRERAAEALRVATGEGPP